MSSYTDQDEEDEPKHICWRCVGEPLLRAGAKKDGALATCSYCDKRGRCMTIGKLADNIEKAFQDHYEVTPTEPTGLEYAMLREGDSDWERRGQPFSEAVQEAALIEEEPAKDVVSLLSDRHYDRSAAEVGEAGPFDRDNYYEQKAVDDIVFQSQWEYFEERLKVESRFFNGGAQAVLDEVFADLSTDKRRGGKPVIVEAGPGKDIAALYRARVFQSQKSVTEAMKLPDQHIGPPPFHLAQAGRMNAHGISMFYGATNAQIALSEVRPPVGSHVLSGRFELLRAVRLLDVGALHDIEVSGSIFDVAYVTRLERAKFLDRVSARISRVVMPDDQPFEYLITQAVADYLANRADLNLDGIIYPSAQSEEEGMNVALFQRSSRVELIVVAEGVTLEADLMTGDDEGYYLDPAVLEFLPPDGKARTTKRKRPDWPPDLGEFHKRQFDADPDQRKPTLQLDLTSVTLHEIDAVKFKTTSKVVRRIPIKERDLPF